MFLHVFRYKIKSIAREHWCVRWNFIFPLAIATAFYFGFGNMIKDDPDAFKAIPVAIVENDTETAFSGTVRKMSEGTGDDRMFELTVTSDEKSAMKLLSSGSVTGVFLEDKNGPSLTVNDNGTEQTILAEFLTEYENYTETMGNIALKDPAGVGEAAEYLASDTEVMKEKAVAESTQSPYLQYFYALIAMACLYGSWITASIIESISANESAFGARYECAPVKKIVSFTASAAAALVFVFSSTVLLMLYINFVLDIKFEGEMPAMLAAALLGSFIGVSAGLFVGVVSGRNASLRIAVPLAFSMVSSFLGGLMYGGMKQLIEVNVPLINRINPASLISDAFYTLGMYGTGRRFYRDCADMLIMSAVFIVLSAVIFRRRSYASI
jgi:ABC-2 type transport system permease protein